MPLLRLVPRETLPSYISRLAASKGVKTPAFAYDLAGAFKRFLQGDSEVVKTLSNWAGLSDHDMEEMLSWTGTPFGKTRLQFRGESVVLRALRNPVVVGCPTCLREDAQDDLAKPLTRMSMRGDWQMREVSVCLRHRRLLVPLWREAGLLQRFDMQHQLSRILDRIMSGELEGDSVRPSEFDRWLDDRLSDGTDTTWLAPHGTAASASFCRMFGQGLIAGAEAHNPIRWRQEAAAAGFEIVRRGPDALKESLILASACASTAADPVRQAHGALFFALESHLQSDPSFDVFRSVLREAVLDIWPLAAGERVLGATLTERRLHSVASASAEVGVDGERLRPMLIEAGALSQDDPRPDARATFDARTFAPMLADIPRLLTTKDMCARFGMTSVELAALHQGGVITPRTAVTEARAKWLPDNGQALLDDLKRHAGRTVAKDVEKGWASIQRAQARTGVCVTDILKGIQEGRIALRQTEPKAGYQGFVVLVDGVLAYGEQVQGRECLSGELSLAEFGRSIGIRELNRLMALVEVGDLTVRNVIHPVTRRPQLRVDESAMAAFQHRFLTLAMIDAELGLPRMSARKLLSEAGIAAYATKGKTFDRLFLRAEAEPVLRWAIQPKI